MRAHLTHETGFVRIRAVVGTGAPGDFMADMEFDIRPGDRVGHLTYDQLVALGEGEHEIPDPEPPRAVT